MLYFNLYVVYITRTNFVIWHVWAIVVIMHLKCWIFYQLPLVENLTFEVHNIG